MRFDHGAVKQRDDAGVSDDEAGLMDASTGSAPRRQRKGLCPAG